jgi:predicted amidohydrolase YtcJ
MKFTSLLIITLFVCSCYQSEEADLVVHNARIQSMDESQTVYDAMAVKDGRIIELGPERQILNKYRTSERYDAGSKWIFPGLIDGHCHFLGYGLNKQKVDLRGTKSFEEVLDRVEDFADSHPEREWIVGRGWDQNDWEIKEYPDYQRLNTLFPTTPVLLQRIDGHAALINQAAIKKTKLDTSKQIEGGQLVVKNGAFTGVLIDNAVDVFQDIIDNAPEHVKHEALLRAQSDCFSEGLTSVHDAGLDVSSIELIESMIGSGELRIRMNVMVSDKEENLAYFEKRGPIATERLDVHTIKVYADGALGSRGAYLKTHYHDTPGHSGLMLHGRQHILGIASWCKRNGFQLATHCIGDAANEMVLGVYAEVLGGTNDARWRIEHAQVVDPSDLKFFKNYNILPSVQPTHATSDMYWAEERLGAKRLAHAYSYRDLRAQNGIMLLGTDFPVEEISPMNTLHAATERTDANGYPAGGFLPDQKLSPSEALRGMTLENALGAFRESDLGTLEPGKLADFIVVGQDLLNLMVPAYEVKVLRTYLGGELVFER